MADALVGAVGAGAGRVAGAHALCVERSISATNRPALSCRAAYSPRDRPSSLRVFLGPGILLSSPNGLVFGIEESVQRSAVRPEHLEHSTDVINSVHGHDGTRADRVSLWQNVGVHGHQASKRHTASSSWARLNLRWLGTDI